MKRLYRSGILSAPVLLTIALNSAFAGQPIEPRPGVAQYAKIYGISYAEAMRRQDKEIDIGKLQVKMQRELPDSYAGLRLEYSPKYHVIVRFTGDAKGKLKLFTSDPELVAEIAPRSLIFMESVLAEALAKLDANKVPYEGYVDEPTSEIIILTEDPVKARKILANLLEAYDFIHLEKGAPPTPMSIIGGQRNKSSDTSSDTGYSESTLGFNVVDESREIGVVSAAHAGTTIYEVDGLPRVLVWQAGSHDGDYDLRWHKQTGTFGTFQPQPNEIKRPGILKITGTTALANVVLNSTVCKYGITTFETCGRVSSKSVGIRYAGVSGYYMRVTPLVRGKIVSKKGDSGGPVYLSSGSAVGLTVAGDDVPNHVFYGAMYAMSIDKLARYGLSVITEPFKVTSVPDVSAPMNTLVPVNVNFTGYPRFPLRLEIVNVSCPPAWNCSSGGGEVADTQASPIAYTWSCETNDPAAATATFVYRTKIVGGDNVESDEIAHTMTCVGAGKNARGNPPLFIKQSLRINPTS